jgi:hypothetical protein
MPVQRGPRIQIRDLIRRAEEQGCKLHMTVAQLDTPSGLRSIRYLYNPATNGRFDISDYEDDEYMLASEMDAAARRLEITLP